jgi:hypothetical protein
MNNKHFVHGGDVQAISSTIPKNAKPMGHKPIALGEKSGHMHVVTGDVQLFIDDNGVMYGAVGSDGATLQHVHESIFDGNYNSQKIYQKADHNQVSLKPNTNYMFGIHKRYNPLAKHWVKSLD